MNRLTTAGSTAWFHGEVDPARPNCPATLAIAQRLIAVDHDRRMAHVARLRELSSTNGVRVFSAHDPGGFNDHAAPGAASPRSPHPGR